MIRPPASTPTEAPAAPAKLYPPIAFARSGGSGNSVITMPRATAVARAPPMPCTNLAMTSMGWLADRPQASDATVNTARPVMKIRLRPARSPRRPASSSRPPNAIR